MVPLAWRSESAVLPDLLTFVKRDYRKLLASVAVSAPKDVREASATILTEAIKRTLQESTRRKIPKPALQDRAERQQRISTNWFKEKIDKYVRFTPTQKLICSVT
jgi:hypothetical protein